MKQGGKRRISMRSCIGQKCQKKSIEDTIRLVNPLPFDRDILRSELMQHKEYLDTQKKRPYANRTAMFKNHHDALNVKQSE